MNVNVVENILTNNLVSVTLDIRNNGIRTQKRLDIKYLNKPSTLAEKGDKKAKKELIKKMVAKMELESLYADFIIDNGYDLTRDFYEYAKEFTERKAPKSDIRTYRAVVNSLKSWHGKEALPCGSISEHMMSDFKDFLEAKHHGISAHNYFKKLKKIFKEATIAKHFKIDPTEKILNKKGKCAVKDTLTIEELRLLSETPCSNITVKNAFLFCCYTGIRHCDTICLKWGNIRDGEMDIIQTKTKERLQVKLHRSAISLMGEKRNPLDLIFRLPTHTGCLKILKNWAASAGLEKHLTWHVARHSFATALFAQDVDILTVSNFLGHKNMVQTQTYLRISDGKKQTAINKLPALF